jgi:hypothetical protein
VYFYSASLRKTVFGIDPTTTHKILIKDIYSCGQPCQHKSNHETVRNAIKRNTVYSYFSTSLFGLSGFLFLILTIMYIANKINFGESPPAEPLPEQSLQVNPSYYGYYVYSPELTQ